MGLHESKQYSEIKVKNTNFEWLTFIGHFIPIYTHTKNQGYKASMYYFR